MKKLCLCVVLLYLFLLVPVHAKNSITCKISNKDVMENGSIKLNIDKINLEILNDLENISVVFYNNELECVYVSDKALMNDPSVDYLYLDNGEVYIGCFEDSFINKYNLNTNSEFMNGDITINFIVGIADTTTALNYYLPFILIGVVVLIIASIGYLGKFIRSKA